MQFDPASRFQDLPVSPAWGEDDLLQEALARLLRRPPRNPSALPAALQTTRRRLRISVLRYETRHPHEALDPERVAGAQEQDPSATAERHELLASLSRAMSLLPAPEEEALRLRIWENLSLRDVAERLGISESCAQSRIHRALSHLRGRLAARKNPA